MEKVAIQSTKAVISLKRGITRRTKVTIDAYVVMRYRLVLKCMTLNDL